MRMRAPFCVARTTYARNSCWCGRPWKRRMCFLVTPVAGLRQPRSRSAEGQERARRDCIERHPALGEEDVADDFSLLLEPVASERLSGLELIAIARERMPSKRQVQATVALG